MKIPLHKFSGVYTFIKKIFFFLDVRKVSNDQFYTREERRKRSERRKGFEKKR